MEKPTQPKKEASPALKHRREMMKNGPEENLELIDSTTRKVEGLEIEMERIKDLRDQEVNKKKREELTAQLRELAMSHKLLKKQAKELAKGTDTNAASKDKPDKERAVKLPDIKSAKPSKELIGQINDLFRSKGSGVEGRQEKIDLLKEIYGGEWVKNNITETGAKGPQEDIVNDLLNQAVGQLEKGESKKKNLEKINKNKNFLDRINKLFTSEGASVDGRQKKIDLLKEIYGEKFVKENITETGIKGAQEDNINDLLRRAVGELEADLEKLTKDADGGGSGGKGEKSFKEQSREITDKMKSLKKEIVDLEGKTGGETNEPKPTDKPEPGEPKPASLETPEPVPASPDEQERQERLREREAELVANVEKFRLAYAKKDIEVTGKLGRLKNIFGRFLKSNPNNLQATHDDYNQYKIALTELMDFRLERMKNSSSPEEQRAQMEKLIKYFNQDEKTELYGARTEARAMVLEEKWGRAGKLAGWLGGRAAKYSGNFINWYRKIGWKKKMVVGVGASLLGLGLINRAAGSIVTGAGVAGVMEANYRRKENKRLAAEQARIRSEVESARTPEEKYQILMDKLTGEMNNYQSEMKKEIRKADRRKIWGTTAGALSFFLMPSVGRYISEKLGVTDAMQGVVANVKEYFGGGNKEYIFPGGSEPGGGLDPEGPHLTPPGAKPEMPEPGGGTIPPDWEARLGGSDKVAEAMKEEYGDYLNRQPLERPDWLDEPINAPDAGSTQGSLAGVGGKEIIGDRLYHRPGGVPYHDAPVIPGGIGLETENTHHSGYGKPAQPELGETYTENTHHSGYGKPAQPELGESYTENTHRSDYGKPAQPELGETYTENSMKMPKGGSGVGLETENSLKMDMEKNYSPAKPEITGGIEQNTEVLPDQSAAPETTVVETPIDGLETAKRGDSVWKMIDRNLGKNFGSEYSQLTPEQKTYVIDYFKDRVAENPGDFGLKDIDKVKAGQKVDFSSLFENRTRASVIFSDAENLSPEKLENIAKNNRSIFNWIKKHPGEFLTSSKAEEILGTRPKGGGMAGRVVETLSMPEAGGKIRLSQILIEKYGMDPVRAMTAETEWAYNHNMDPKEAFVSSKAEIKLHTNDMVADITEPEPVEKTPKGPRGGGRAGGGGMEPNLRRVGENLEQGKCSAVNTEVITEAKRADIVTHVGQDGPIAPKAETMGNAAAGMSLNTKEGFGNAIENYLKSRGASSTYAHERAMALAGEGAVVQAQPDGSKLLIMEDGRTKIKISPDGEKIQGMTEDVPKNSGRGGGASVERGNGARLKNIKADLGTEASSGSVPNGGIMEGLKGVAKGVYQDSGLEKEVAPMAKDIANAVTSGYEATKEGVNNALRYTLTNYYEGKGYLPEEASRMAEKSIDKAFYTGAGSTAVVGAGLMERRRRKKKNTREALIPLRKDEFLREAFGAEAEKDIVTLLASPDESAKLETQKKVFARLTKECFGDKPIRFIDLAREDAKEYLKKHKKEKVWQVYVMSQSILGKESIKPEKGMNMAKWTERLFNKLIKARADLMEKEMAAEPKFDAAA